VDGGWTRSLLNWLIWSGSKTTRGRRLAACGSGYRGLEEPNRSPGTRARCRRILTLRAQGAKPPGRGPCSLPADFEAAGSRSQPLGRSPCSPPVDFDAACSRSQPLGRSPCSPPADFDVAGSTGVVGQLGQSKFTGVCARAPAGLPRLGFRFRIWVSGFGFGFQVWGSGWLVCADCLVREDWRLRFGWLTTSCRAWEGRRGRRGRSSGGPPAGRGRCFPPRSRRRRLRRR
jgi:hypothetical protein